MTHRPLLLVAALLVGCATPLPPAGPVAAAAAVLARARDGSPPAPSVAEIRMAQELLAAAKK